MSARTLLAAAVLLASLGLPSIGYGQTADPDLSWINDPRWRQVAVLVINPCDAVREALPRVGRSTTDTSGRTTWRNSWRFVIPVLDRVSTDSQLAADPDAILAALDDQIRQSQAYSMDRGQQVIRTLQDWANTTAARFDAGDSVPPGQAIVAGVMRLPDLRHRWEIAAQVSGLVSSQQRQLWDQLGVTIAERDTLTCGRYSCELDRALQRGGSGGLSGISDFFACG